MAYFKKLAVPVTGFLGVAVLASALTVPYFREAEKEAVRQHTASGTFSDTSTVTP